MHVYSILWGSDIERWSSARSQKIKALTDMLVPNSKKELQAFLGIINYLGKFSPGTPNVCDPLHKLTSSKVTWTWNVSYQALFNKAKLLIKVDMCMKFYDDTKPLYLETDASRISLGVALLQMYERTTCQKHITCRYSNIERGALGILHGLKKFHHYCFAREVLVITDHKQLVAIF